MYYDQISQGFHQLFIDSLLILSNEFYFQVLVDPLATLNEV